MVVALLAGLWTLRRTREAFEVHEDQLWELRRAERRLLYGNPRLTDSWLLRKDMRGNETDRP